MKTIDKIIINSYNIHDQIIDTGCIVFNFEAETVSTNKKTYKVISDSEYTFKVVKKANKILAIGGIYGFYKFIKEINRAESAYNPTLTNLFINKY